MLVHPAKAVGHSEMPFDSDTCVVPRDPSPSHEGVIWGSEPYFHNNAAYCQVTLAVVKRIRTVSHMSRVVWHEPLATGSTMMSVLLTYY